MTSCSQISTIFQPMDSNSSRLSLSLSTFLANLRLQNAVWVFGSGKFSLGHRCHQHPWTKTTSLARGYTKSGLPGSPLLTSLFLSNLDNSISGRVPDALFDLMEREILAELGPGDGPTGLEAYDLGSLNSAPGSLGIGGGLRY